VSLSFKAAQEDRLRQFARMGGIGQILPATVISLLPGGAVVRLEDGMSGFVPTTELVEPGNVLEEVAPVGSEIFVKALAINMNTHKVSMSLRQADNEFEDSDEFADLALYGAHPQLDENDEYIWPEGWDPAESAWLSGFDAQREAWEQQYLKAQERREGHRRQVQRRAVRRVLPSDEVLAVLRAKLTGSR
jgi:small subunit ribosomal protein S1